MIVLCDAGGPPGYEHWCCQRPAGHDGSHGDLLNRWLDKPIVLGNGACTPWEPLVASEITGVSDPDEEC